MAATEILSATQADGQLFHQPRPRRVSPASSSLFLAGSTPPFISSPKPIPATPHAEHNETITKSSPLASLRTPPQPPKLTIPRAFSLDSIQSNNSRSIEDTSKEDDEIDLPNYGSFSFTSTDDGYESSTRGSEDDAPEISTTTDTTQSDSPLATPTIQDDTAIQQEPTRHVDYLSHDWREEDIWASWRHIVSQRRVYGQKSRLENASWRTWAKSKYQLRTISPETLNWLKESDVTWLYGPLKPATSHPVTSSTSGQNSSQISKSSSFVKKPILKKRSVSEVMLQKSLSTSSLLKQAAASAQAQRGKQTLGGPSASLSDFTYSYYSAPSNPPSRDEGTDYFSSSRSSSSIDAESPCDSAKEKHIRFDEKVEQCIAVECKGTGFEDDEEPEADNVPTFSALSESSSDEGLVMMKRNRRSSSKREGPQKGKLSRTNSSSGMMIETLPSTTLKYRTDSPDVTQEPAAQHHVFGKDWGAKLAPSPSQETLRPSRPSRNFLLGNDDDDEDPNNSSWSFGAGNPKSSLGASASSPTNPMDGYDGIEGMRRTESGMFMPYDEDEDDMVASTLFGRVSETINTVRDISHVLWNVGWRK